MPWLRSNAVYGTAGAPGGWRRLEEVEDAWRHFNVFCFPLTGRLVQWIASRSKPHENALTTQRDAFGNPTRSTIDAFAPPVTLQPLSPAVPPPLVIFQSTFGQSPLLLLLATTPPIRRRNPNNSAEQFGGPIFRRNASQSPGLWPWPPKHTVPLVAVLSETCGNPY